MTTLTGRIVEVTTYPLGDVITVAASLGATTLTLNSTANFNLDGTEGAQVQIVDPVTDAVFIASVVGADHLVGTITLGAPLPWAVPADTPIAVFPLGEVRIAQVLLDDDEGEGGPIPVRVPQSLYDRTAEGVRDPGDEESVVVTNGDNDGPWTVADSPGVIPLIDGSYFDPGTVPEAAPVAPIVSPVPVVRAGPAAAVVTWDPTGDALRTLVDLHVAAVNTSPPDSTTLHTEAVGQPAYVQKLPDGTDIPTGGDVYFALVARNDAGTAPASAWVAGRAGIIPPGYEVVLAGEVIATRLTGQTVEGMTLKGSILDIFGSLYVDAVGAKFTGIIDAVSATFRDNVFMLGLKNYLAGKLTLANGVPDPNSAPTVSSTWNSLTTTIEGSYAHGLTDDVASTNWVSVFTFGGVTLNLINKGTGAHLTNAVTGLPPAFNPVGIARVSTTYYILGQNFGSPGNPWQIAPVDAATFAAGTLHTIASFAPTKVPTIGATGSELLLAWSDASSVRVRRYTASTLAVVSTETMSWTGTPPDLGGVGQWFTNPAGSGFPRLYVAPQNASMRAFTTVGGLDTPSNYFRPNDVTIRGLHHDGTRFRVLDDVARIWDYSRHPGGSHDFGFTWYDSTLTGGRAETKISPIRTATVARGARPTVTITAPPYDGTTDGANTGHVYAAPTGTTVTRQTPLNVGLTPDGATVWSADELTAVVNAPPAVSDFAGRAATAPGNIVTAQPRAGGGQVVDISGAGPSNLGPYSCDANGYGTLATAYVESSADVNATSTTNVTVTGLTTTLTSPGTGAVWFVDLDADCNIFSGTNVVLVVELLVDGVAEPRTIVHGGAVSQRVGCDHRSYRITGLAAGSRPLTVRCRIAGTGSARVYAGSSLRVQRVA